MLKVNLKVITAVAASVYILTLPAMASQAFHTSHEKSHSAQIQTASWYSTEACKYNKYSGCPTADGSSLYILEERDPYFVASYNYALGTELWVCTEDESRCVLATVRDRGPNKRLTDRSIDLSKQTFLILSDGNLDLGLINVKVEVA